MLLSVAVSTLLLASGFGFSWLGLPLLVAAIALAFLIHHRRARTATPSRTAAPRDSNAIYPCLKEMAWATLGNSLRRPLWEGASSEHMPWAAWGYDRPDRFELLSDFHLPPLGKTVAQIAHEALLNLRLRRASWRPIDTQLEDRSILSLLVCADDFLAAERILDVAFMRDAQRRLGARGLLVGVPRREFLVAMNLDSPIAASTAFVRLVASEYHEAKSAPISPLVFVVKDGAIVGIKDTA